MNKRLFNLVICTAFLLSAVMPVSSMGFARHWSGYASALATAARGAAQRFTAAAPQAARAAHVARMRGISLNVKDAIQKPSSSRMHGLMREATKSRVDRNLVLGIGQCRPFSKAAFSGGVHTDALGLVVSAAAAAATAWYVDDAHCLPEDLKKMTDEAYALDTPELPEDLKAILMNPRESMENDTVDYSYNQLSFWLRDHSVSNTLWGQIVRYCQDHFTEINPSYLSAILDANADALNIFISQAIEHFDLLHATEFHSFVITYNAKPARTAGRRLLAQIAYLSPEAQRVFLSKSEAIDPRSNLVWYLKILDKKNKGAMLSLTEAHFIVSYQRYAEEFFIDDIYPFGDQLREQRQQDLYDVRASVVEKEQELIGNGYITFYHAQQSGAFPLILLNTLLCSLNTEEDIDDFYYMYVNDYDAVRCAPAMSESVCSKSIIKSITRKYFQAHHAVMRKGVLSGTNEIYQVPVMFLNGPLCGNTGFKADQTFPQYFVKNINAVSYFFRLLGPDEVTAHTAENVVKCVFKSNSLEEYESIFLEELKKLFEEYSYVSRYGTLYQIAIPVDTISDVITPVAMDFKSKVKVGGEYTDDMGVILSSFRNPAQYPELSRTTHWASGYDKQEFVAFMTSDEHGMMNPKSGVKIFSYMVPCDEARYKNWLAKWDHLKARIKATIESRRTADYIAPVHAESLIGLWQKAYEKTGLKKSVDASGASEADQK